MVDIQPAAAEIRRGKKRKLEGKKLQGKNIMAPLLHRAAIISCYVSVGILQIIKRCYVYFAPLPCVCEVDADNEKIALINRTWCRFVLAASSSS